MKPTQEQVIAWAREAGWTGPEENVTYVAMLERFATLAYETGRNTAPPQREWQGLTDEEVRDLWSWAMTAEAERTANTQQHAFARAIEAKLREKNT